jgi:nucleoside-diphosphate-sugar epimerase
MAEKVFVTGAAGYIGGSVASILVKNGYQVKGLTRSAAKAKQLESRGIEPVVGELSDVSLLAKCAAEADIVVDAASSDNATAVKTFIDALAGSDKVFIHTSGSSVVSDRANGEPSDRIFAEDTKYTPDPDKQARVDIDNQVIASAKQGIRSVVICPCMIYGEGQGENSESQQVPTLIKQAIKSDTARCIGRGLNIWSTIHIQDLTDLYLTVIKNAPQGGVFLFAESGEVSLKDVAEKIRTSLSIKNPVNEWPVEEAIKELGFGTAVFGLGSNSRIRGEKARKMGWKPTRESILDDVPRCCSHFVALVK